jgi:hypothetical protein
MVAMAATCVPLGGSAQAIVIAKACDWPVSHRAGHPRDRCGHRCR